MVEAFVLRLPGVQRSQGLRPVAYFPAGNPGARPVAILEVGAPLDAPLDAALGRRWPLRTNLLINCSGAIALLATLLVLALRFRSYIAGQRLAQEVDLARRVQQDLHPTPRDTSTTFDLAADYEPATDLGGDFYDAFPVLNGAAFVLGDVSGKGIPAALPARGPAVYRPRRA